MIRHIRIAALLSMALLLAALASSCKKQRNATDSSQQYFISDSFFKQLGFDTTRIHTVESELNLIGSVAFDDDKVVKIFSFSGGIIQSLRVELGDYVRKGQTLAVIRSTEMADYQNQQVSALSDMELARKNALQAKDMYANQLISEKDYIAAQKELQKAESELRRINEILSIYGDETASGYTIKSPISGYIVQRNAAEDMEFRADSPDPLFTISNLNRIWVIGNVYESDIPKIKLGYEADVRTISYPDRIFKGKIDKIYNVIDPDTKALKIRVDLDNPELMLKPDMFANICVRYDEHIKLICIPSEAIVFDNSKNYVMVFHNKRDIETREVQIYRVTGSNTYILSGLQEGEVIITSNSLVIYNALHD